MIDCAISKKELLKTLLDFFQESEQQSFKSQTLLQKLASKESDFSKATME